MREIRFRGKKITDNWWIHGSLEQYPKIQVTYIHQYYPDIPYHIKDEVIPDTVGQFTGLQDSKGTDVYEGDILRYPQNNKTYQVVFKDGIFFGEGRHGCGCAAHFFPSCEVLGNIIDNPELIVKGGDHE